MNNFTSAWEAVDTESDTIPHTHEFYQGDNLYRFDATYEDMFRVRALCYRYDTQQNTAVNTPYSTLSVFPNPAADHIEIRLSGNSDFRICNAEGRLVLSGNTDGVISVADLPPGVYQVTVQTSDSVKMATFVK